jgi:hypothetical protein
MDYIEYYSDDYVTAKRIPKDVFLSKESWNLPFEFVKYQADLNEDIRLGLYHQLLRRAKTPSYINQIKESPYYNDLYKDILKSDNLIDKVDLALYFDNDLIETTFNGIDNLVEEIINYDKKDEFYYSLAMRLADISKFDIDSSQRERIIEGIEILLEKDYEEIKGFEDEFTLPESIEENLITSKERNKRAFISKVNENGKVNEK